MWIHLCLALFVSCLQGLDVFLRAGAVNQDVDVVYESQSNGSHVRACINFQQVSVMERIAIKGKMDDLCGKPMVTVKRSVALWLMTSVVQRSVKKLSYQPVISPTYASFGKNFKQLSTGDSVQRTCYVYTEQRIHFVVFLPLNIVYISHWLLSHVTIILRASTFPRPLR